MAETKSKASTSTTGNAGSSTSTRRTKQTKTSAPVLNLSAAVSVQKLADLMDVNGVEVIKQLMRRGIMATINQVIDYDTAATIATDFGFYATQAAESPSSEAIPSAQIKEKVEDKEESRKLKIRPPVVTVLGHVDHGKTTLLDAIRKTSVTSSEKGGITQHIGAYQAQVNNQKITFLDTPGHEAFTAMRARGAKVTDIAVLVVAADDGVMPQTKEALDHATAAGVPMVVAINKIDKAGANVDKVKQQLSDLNLVPEEWGGDTIMAPISAQTGEGIPELLENILLVAEISELKANPDRKAQGVVIEARLDTARGPVATVLVQSGTLKVGDAFMVGDITGKVRAMFNHLGEKIQEAGPSTPVEVLGLTDVPRAGDRLVVEMGGKKSRIAERRRRESEAGATSAATSLERLLAQVRAGDAKELNIILKTDVEGSGEAIRGALEKLDSEKIKVRVIRSSSGNVTESDVLLAAASKAVIVAFNARPEAGARRMAEKEGVHILYHDIIYNLIKDVQALATGMLEPVYRDVVEGKAEVRDTFSVKGGKVAGVAVTEGRIPRNGMARVLRDGAVIFDSNIKSLKHFKDSVRELTAGLEGGIGIEGFNDFEVGDTIQAYRKERVQPAQS